MKKTVIILSLILSHLGFSQITESGVTSTASAAGDHAFVGTKSDGVFSNWLNTGYSATAYNLLGFSNQHAGFGVADGNNIVSPIVWMYANDRNAFRVRTINFNTNLTSGTDLFTVRANGNVGIGTTSPSAKLDVRFSGEGGVFAKAISNGTHGASNFVADAATGFPSRFLFRENGSNKGWIDHLGGKINVRNGASKSLLTVDLSSENVGIGTTTPTQKLEVKGSIQLKSDSYITYGIERENGAKSAFGITSNTHDGFLSSSGSLKFLINNNGTSYNTGMLINSNGNIGIGTTNINNWKLAVNGNIRAKEIKVEAGWADFVFENNYNLPTLKEVEAHIKQKGHLKDIPSAKEVAENGIFLGEMDSKLLQKIEELTLYTINQGKDISKLKKENQELKHINSKLVELQKRLEKLESKK